ncbi:MAG TPA: cyclic nucleotide-binding domain-containing protein [Intrasporangiaceae bacterium]|nr:cyclic nucleotide-binding domain-containing protein [Intrasporangiaceae bacterium]
MTAGADPTVPAPDTPERVAVLVIGDSETADRAEAELASCLAAEADVVRIREVDPQAWAATDLSNVAVVFVDVERPSAVVTDLATRTQQPPRVLLLTRRGVLDDLGDLVDADLLAGVVAVPWTPGRLCVQARAQLARWHGIEPVTSIRHADVTESSLLRSLNQPLREVVRELVDAIEDVLGPRPRLLLPAGIRVTQEDVSVDGLLIVLRGEIALGVTSPSGKIVLHHASTGPLIGLPALIERQRALATAHATTDVELIHLTIEQLDHALDDNSRVGALMTVVSMRSLARRLRRAEILQVEKSRLNAELADERAKLTQALEDLSEARLALIAQARSATIGDMAAGIAHELNSPLSALTRSIDHSEQDVLTILSGHPWTEPILDVITAARDRPALTAKDERRIRRELAAAGIPNGRVRALVSAGVFTVATAQRIGESGIPDDQLEAAAGLGAALRNARLAEQHISTLVSSLRSAIRPDQTEPVPTAVSETVEDALRLAGHRMHGIEVRRDYVDTEPVLAHPAQLTQIWTNLIVNAADALAGSGTIEIRVRPRPRGGVRVEVRDDGPGIDPALQERIFEPRFTTKAGAVRFGLGLGLGIARRIVTEHAGTITVHSQPGETVFTVDLPAHLSTPPEGAPR